MIKYLIKKPIVLGMDYGEYEIVVYPEDNCMLTVIDGNIVLIDRFRNKYVSHTIINAIDVWLNGNSIEQITFKD